MVCEREKCFGSLKILVGLNFQGTKDVVTKFAYGIQTRKKINSEEATSK